MAKLVLLTGPQAVGKMTVGQELAKITGLKLFHNHMTIDLALKFFDYSTKEGQKLVDDLRMDVFEAVAKSDLEGIIFTCVIAYESKEDLEILEKIKKVFVEKGGEVYYVELQAPLEVRLERNKTENRRKHKEYKRNIEHSEMLLLRSETKHRMESKEGEVKEKNYLKIDNTNIEAKEVARIIKEKFNL